MKNSLPVSAAIVLLFSLTQSTTYAADTDSTPLSKPGINAPSEESAADGGVEVASHVVVSTDRSTSGRPKWLGRKLRVWLVLPEAEGRSTPALEKLQSPGGEFEILRKVGWKIGAEPESHLQLVSASAATEWLGDLDGKPLPLVVAVEEGAVVRSFQSGCTTPLDRWTFGWLLKGEDERPASAPSEPARVASTGNYRLRGNHWSVEGDWQPSKATVIAHLQGVNHGHKTNGKYTLESWSLEELLSLHDDLHEQEGGTIGGSAGFATAGAGGGLPGRSALPHGGGSKLRSY